MAVARYGHCAVAALRNEIYIFGDYYTCVLEVFDTAILEWSSGASLCGMPGRRDDAAIVVLKNR